MRRTYPQRILMWLIFALLGFVALGSILDAFANAISFVSVRTTYFLSAGLLAAWAVVEILLRVWPARWNVGDHHILIRGLGTKVRLAIVGATALLWLPRVADMFRQSPSTETQATRRVAGLLEAAHTETCDSIISVQQDYCLSNKGIVSSLPPNLPDAMLDTIRSDGEAYSSLSDPMRERISKFIRTLRTLRDGHNAAAKLTTEPVAQPGTLALMLLECRTVELCLRLERAYQVGEINRDEHATRFAAADHLAALVLRIQFCWSLDANAGLQVKWKSLKIEAVAKHAFWVGQEFDACARIVNGGTPISDAQLNVLKQMERRLIALSMPFDTTELLRECAGDSKKAERVLDCFHTALVAYHGDSAAATFTFGTVFSQTMDTFESFLTDSQFRKEFLSQKRSVFTVGDAINSLINTVMLPDEIKKYWTSIYAGTIVGAPETVEQVTKWRKLVFAHYQDPM